MTDDQDLTRRHNPGQDLVEEGMDDHVPTQSPEEIGEEKGSAIIPTGESSEDMVEDITEEPLKPEQTFWDKINEAERNRRIGRDEEPEVKPEDIDELDTRDKEVGPEVSLESLREKEEDEEDNNYES